MGRTSFLPFVATISVNSKYFSSFMCDTSYFAFRCNNKYKRQVVKLLNVRRFLFRILLEQYALKAGILVAFRANQIKMDANVANKNRNVCL